MRMRQPCRIQAHCRLERALIPWRLDLNMDIPLGGTVTNERSECEATTLLFANGSFATLSDQLISLTASGRVVSLGFVNNC